MLSGPVAGIEAKTLSQPYDSAAVAPDDGGDPKFPFPSFTDIFSASR